MRRNPFRQRERSGDGEEPELLEEVRAFRRILSLYRVLELPGWAVNLDQRTNDLVLGIV